MVAGTTDHRTPTPSVDSCGQNPEAPLFLPEKSPVERRIAALIFLASLAYLCLFRRYTMMEPDEGIILQGAERILHGEVLYRDFFSFFTPGSYYLLALLFKIFGSSMLVARTALAVYGSIFPVVTYLLARRVCSKWISLVTAGMVTLTCLPYRFLVLHNWDSTLWACLAVYGAVRYLESPIGTWAFATSTFAALTILFEQSKGAGLVVGLGAGFILLALSGRQTVPRRAVGVAVATGFAWPFLVTFAWFGAHHSLGPMLADWIWPLQHYSSANLVPYGYQNWSDSTRATLFGDASWGVRLVVFLAVAPGFIFPVLPLAAAVVFVCCAASSISTRRLGIRGAYYLIVSAAITGLLLSVIVVRADIIHFMYLAPLLYLVLVWALREGPVRSGLVAALRPALCIFLLTTLGLFAAVLAARCLGAKVKIQTRRGVVTASAADSVVQYVQAHVAPGSRILVYPYLPLYYFLTATFGPTRFEFLQPGMHTAEQASEIVRDLARDRTPVVLYEISFAEKIPRAWPNTPIEAIAKDPVGDWISSHYKPCKLLHSAARWSFLYMIPKDLACPDDFRTGETAPSD